jgi:hypothetical protein
VPKAQNYGGKYLKRTTIKFERPEFDQDFLKRDQKGAALLRRS